MKKAKYIYLANIFLGFHYYIIVYLNSSFLSKFVGDSTINFLYITGALLNTLLFFFLPSTLRHMKTRTLTALIIALEFFIVFGLSRATTALTAALLFILQQAIGPLILYCLDLFLEAAMPNEKNTGKVRGYFLTALNISLVISFAFVSWFAADNNFSPVYAISAIMLVPILIILSTRLSEYQHHREAISVKSVVRALLKDLDIARILVANIVLQFFYALMVIYLPLLLRQTIGFEWQDIGLILIIMILPFLIFEIPVGKIIDKRTGEKEFLFLGFIIMAVACFAILFIKEQTFWLWALILFISRIGAALVEISNESYFFKKVDERHASLVSLFRMTASIGYVLAPAVAIPLLFFTSYSGLFAVLGIVCLMGLLFIPKVDTK